ncbi:Transposase InsO and inactivated derivatives [Thermoactinomyces sp. DSM 45891]|nr:Transposase InsO and inactivated derivatives [Thermoactinomyces sp. DSM 45891]
MHLEEGRSVNSLTKEYGLGAGSLNSWGKKYREEYKQTNRMDQSNQKEIYHRYGGKMGYRMIQRRLAHEGHLCSQVTVYKYMKELGLRSIVFKRKPPYVKSKKHRVFPNVLAREFTAEYPNQRWCIDFTYIHLASGQIYYNCSILDLNNRRIVSTKTASYITADLAIKTLQMALHKCSPKKGVIVHSDQGVQFTSKSFTEFCSKNGIIQSMSASGCPYDNAPMESFFGKLKNEHLNHYVIKDFDHLNQLIDDYIFRYYHHIRPHSALNGKTPMEV